MLDGISFDEIRGDLILVAIQKSSYVSYASEVKYDL